MKRSSALKRTRLARGPSKLSRSRLRPIGKRGRLDREALAAVRSEVMHRAGFRCERCGQAANAVGPLHLHHRRTRAQGGTHDLWNLVALCRVCHAQVHAGAKDAGRWIVTRRGGA